MSYKGTHRSLSDIARDLGVATIAEARTSFRQPGRITSVCSRAEGASIWSGTYKGFRMCWRYRIR